MRLRVPRGYQVGAWTVEKPLAEGAFGAVHSAYRTSEGEGEGEPERVALKFLPTGTSTPRQLRHLRDLIDREVELLRRVSHPRLIRMYETLTVEAPDQPELDGATVLVLEHAERSLADLLDVYEPPFPSAGSALASDGAGRSPAAHTPVEITEILAQVCEGIAQVHKAGWVHGDLKPANVLLMADDSVRLSDFNLAAELEGSHAYSPAFSTPDYSPPELLGAEFSARGRQTRPTADIWALGVLAHVTLTGTYPMPGGTASARRDAAVRYAKGSEELRLSPGLPPAWQDVILRCMARTHEERAAHGPETLVPAIRAAGRDRGARARRRRPAALGRRARWSALVTVAGTAVLIGAGFPLFSASGEDTQGGGKQEASGYERCLTGNICFFSEHDGHGEMCAWYGDDPNWFKGDIRCTWPVDTRVRSVYNNGRGPEHGEQYVDVVYFDEVGHRGQRLGCVPVGEHVNLATSVRPRSHTWAERC